MCVHMNKVHKYSNNVLPDLFSMSNRVKQGSVTSPLLFNIYMDIVLSKLKHTVTMLV